MKNYEDYIQPAIKPAIKTLPKLLNERETADLLGLSERTLRTYRAKGQGPKYIQIAPHTVRYSVEDILIFYAENSSSQGGAS